MKKPFFPKAFTLIELLVSVAIIGILAALVLAAVQSTRVRARDTQRKGDLNQIAKALEMYYSDNEKYPFWVYDQVSDTDHKPPQDASFASLDHTGWREKGTGGLNDALGAYIKKLPIDPINSYSISKPYFYLYFGIWYWGNLPANGTITAINGDSMNSYLGDGSTYALYARLENANDSDRGVIKHTKIFASPSTCAAGTNALPCLDSNRKIYEEDIALNPASRAINDDDAFTIFYPNVKLGGGGSQSYWTGMRNQLYIVRSVN